MGGFDVAKEAGALISFDPNIREPLWNSMDDAKQQVQTVSSEEYDRDYGCWRYV